MSIETYIRPLTIKLLSSSRRDLVIKSLRQQDAILGPAERDLGCVKSREYGMFRTVPAVQTVQTISRQRLLHNNANFSAITKPESTFLAWPSCVSHAQLFGLPLGLASSLPRSPTTASFLIQRMRRNELRAESC